ncbi:249_t:CDS:2, partial [Cetraspora pellucida]
PLQAVLREIAIAFCEATAGEDDPLEWIKTFDHAANTNNWSQEQKLKIASDYLHGIAANWYDEIKEDLEYRDNEHAPDVSFVTLFIQYFTTPEHRHKWQVDFNTLSQKENEQVDSADVFGRLKAKITSWLSIAKPSTLEQVIVGARKIEEHLESNIDELNKCMQMMTTNYEKLTTALPLKSKLTLQDPTLPMIIIATMLVPNVNFVGLKEDNGYTPEVKKKRLKNNLSTVEFHPVNLINEGPNLVMLTLNNFTAPRPCQKKGPSEIDKLKSYNKSSSSSKKAVPSRRDPSTTLQIDEDKYRPNEGRCAGVSIMLKKTMDRLKLQINEPSTTIIITANRTLVRALRRIKDLKLVLASIMIPNTFHIIKSTDNMLLLNMDWFKKACVWLHFDEQKLFVNYMEQLAEILIFHDEDPPLLKSDDRDEF